MKAEALCFVHGECRWRDSVLLGPGQSLGECVAAATPPAHFGRVTATSARRAGKSLGSLRRSNDRGQWNTGRHHNVCRQQRASQTSADQRATRGAATTAQESWKWQHSTGDVKKIPL
jgi:hypothetical protein